MEENQGHIEFPDNSSGNKSAEEISASEEQQTPSNQTIDATGAPSIETLSLKENFFKFIKSLYGTAKEILNFSHEIDKEATNTNIKADIEFKGFNIWVLICSIVIASVGLNVDSVAVVIGAMLISPLMGPILGIGLSLGTNDLPTMGRSLKSLGIATFVSLLASTVYFVVSPIDEPTPQLISRTTPLPFDVLVAIFGGLAGIFAASRKIKTNVVPGVAIATALMPPLCTAGYGIAHLDWKFFGGAIYLFLINCGFIAVTTLVVVRYLKFPLVQFVDEVRERKIKKYIIICSLVLVLPSLYTLWNFYENIQYRENEKAFIERSEQFINENFKFSEVSGKRIIYSEEEGVNPIIEINLRGENRPETSREVLIKSAKNIDILKNAIIDVNENSTFKDIYKRLQEGEEGEKIYHQEQLLVAAQIENDSLRAAVNKYKSKEINFDRFSRQLKSSFDEIDECGFGYVIYSQKEKTDTLPTLFLELKKRKRLKGDRLKAVENNTRINLSLDTIVVKVN